MTSDLSELPPAFLGSLASQGLFANYRLCGPSGLCATKQYNFTWAVVVNIDPIGHERRYRYEYSSRAAAALEAWDGDGQPSGPCIECKGVNGDLLNAGFGREFMGDPPGAPQGQV